MKRLFLLLLAALLLLLGATACDSGSAAQQQRESSPAVQESPTAGQGERSARESAGVRPLRVVTTIFPPYDFVREIAGDDVELTMLLPPGSESHSYEPTPQDIIAIQECDLFLYGGGESDRWVERLLSAAQGGGFTALPMMDMVETVVEEELVAGMQDDGHGHAYEDEAENHQDEAEYDEHIWTAPANAMAIVRAITEALCGLDPDNEALFRRNAEAYLERLADLDSRYAAMVESAARTTVVFGDRFPFRYLADAYGLEYFAAFPGCSTETEASAATIAFLTDKVAGEQIPVVFTIELSNGKIADVICEGTGAKKLVLHSCHNLARDDFLAGVSYLQLMEQNLENLREALS